MRVRHLMGMGLAGLLVTAGCPPPVEAPSTVVGASGEAVSTIEAAGNAEDPAAPYGADHLVVAGAIEPGWGPSNNGEARVEYVAYYPTTLRVHRGDVVFFRNDGFHTITFGPQGQAREGWLRRDEVEPLISIQHHLPSDPTCGTSAETPPCALDSTGQFVNSGWKMPGTAVANDLKLAVDLPEGAYDYYCTIHSGMEGTIEVVPDDQPVPTPVEVAAQREAEVAADTDTAHDILADPPTMRPPEQVGDHRRWFVQAGEISTDQRVAMLQYFPSSLTIAPGDEVEFFAPAGGPPLPGRTEVAGEAHTVSFEARAAHDNLPGTVRYFSPMCDPDDPQTGLPGVPMLPALLVGCPDDLSLELGLQPYAFPQNAIRAPGNAVATEATYDDSGILFQPDAACRMACDPWTGERFESTSTSSFPSEGQFVYRCFLHGRIMGGAINVSG